MPVNKRETRGGGKRAAAAAIITIAAALLLGARLLALKLPAIRAEKAAEDAYRQAAAMAETGEYEAAIAAFAALGEYKDSAEQLARAQAALAERERIAEAERLEAERGAAYCAAEALLRYSLVLLTDVTQSPGPAARWADVAAAVLRYAEHADSLQSFAFRSAR